MEELLPYFPNLTDKQTAQFKQLKDLYEEWNAQINVISRKDLDFFYTKHVLHSLAITKLITFKPNTNVLDVGTGGGFPAIPLAIYYPEVQFLAIDSIGKKIKVVNAVIEALKLPNIVARHCRAESIEESFDFIVSRAVTRTAKFIPWVDKRFKKNSFNEKKNGYLFLKGGDLSEELAEAKRYYESYAIKDFFSDEFFETKKVIYLPK